LRLTLISDAWHPQVNGIVTTIVQLTRAMERRGHRVEVIAPDRFRTYACPGYPDVRLAFLCGPRLRPLIDASEPEAIHLMTEGPVGFAARRYCRWRGLPFTTSFHSYFPEYLKLRAGIPLAVSYGYLRWFHARSAGVMVAADSLAQDLSAKGFSPLVRWRLGVDTELFRPREKGFIRDPRPILMYVGRVAIEKNIEAFLRLDLPGTRYVIGDGPLRKSLEGRYAGVRFLGYRTGEELARYVAAADVLVFPSLTDTFGLVLLEALACGVPVAAYPVPGPRDVILDPRVGVLDGDLRRATLDALALDPADCRRYALQWSWEQSARAFAEQLVPLQSRRKERRRVFPFV
jgi:glycosyltransferase involved in cell wall biosynthesis